MLHFDAERQRYNEKRVLVPVFRITLHIAEQLVFVGDLAVAFDVVYHLDEVVGESLKVNRPCGRTPPEMKVRLRLVSQLDP